MTSNLPPGWTQDMLERALYGEEEAEVEDENVLYDEAREDRWDI